MKQKKLFFNELLRRYNKYRNRFARLSQTGKNINRQHLLEKRIAAMYEKLQSLQKFIKLRTAVAATALTLFAFQPEAKAQGVNFGSAQTNPFGLANSFNNSSSSFADLDGDGDMDMISGEYQGYSTAANFHYYQNTGSVSAPAFAADAVNTFGLAGLNTGYYNMTRPVFVDLDHDGDFDIVSGNTDGNFYYFENTGTSTAPAFAAVQTNPFSLIGFGASYSYSTPAFVDMDGDGDFDMVSGNNSDDNFYYFKNTGTASAPVFAAAIVNPFSLTSNNDNLPDPTFVDFDHDGDQDMMSGEGSGDFLYYKNIGTSLLPVFATPQYNPFNLSRFNYNSAPALLDLDNDGYLDLMAGTNNGYFGFFRGSCGNPVITISGVNSICLGSSVTLTANSDANNYIWSSNAGSVTTNSISVTPTVATKYYVTSVGSGTCTTKDSVTVTIVHDNPLINTTSGACTDTASVDDFLNKGLVAYYPFNGNANDLSGNGHNATTVGVTLATDRFGRANRSYNFNGTSTYVQCPPSTYFNGDFTISGWVNVSSLGSWARLIDFGNGPASDNILVALSVGNDNRIGTSNYVGGSGDDAESQQVIDFNKWVQVLVTLKGNTRIVYYNGVAIDSITTSQVPANLIRNNCYIGLSNWNDGGVFGSLDDIRIYNRALDSAEVSHLYNYEAIGESQTHYSWSNGSTQPSIVVSPTVATTYTVTETRDGVSCSFTATTTLTPTSFVAPVVIAHATATNLCVGGSTTLTGSGATTYTWSNGVTDGVALMPTTTIQYTVTGTDGNGCIDNDTITVDVNPLPSVVANATSNMVCLGNSTTLSGSGATTYTWTNGVTDGVAFTPTTTVQYTVTGTDANGCVNTDAITVSVNNNPLPTVTAMATATTVCAGDPTTLTGGGASTYVWSNGVTDGVATTPTATTHYTVTGTDGNGCMNDAVITVTVNPLPSLVVSNTSICTGTTFTLTASGALTYTFSGGQVVTPTTTTSYTISGTDVNNCSNTAVATLSVNPLPTVVFNVSPSTFCSTGSIVTLSASPAGGTFSGTGVGAGAFNPASVSVGAHTLSYNYTDANGCTNMDTANVVVQICTGINNYATNHAISVYPNPSNGAFTISTSNLAANTTLVIYNGIGQVVYTQQLSKEVETLNTNLSAGFYTLKLQSAEGISAQRIIIGQ